MNKDNKFKNRFHELRLTETKNPYNRKHIEGGYEYICMSQTELAEAMRLNTTYCITQADISEIENSKKQPTERILEIYKTYFKVNKKWLCGETDIKAISNKGMTFIEINKVLGLSEEALNNIRNLHQSGNYQDEMAILNFILSDKQKFYELLSNLKDYLSGSKYIVPLYCPEGQSTFVPIPNSTKNQVVLGEPTKDNKGNAAYNSKSFEFDISTQALNDLNRLLVLYKEVYKHKNNRISPL